MLDVMMFSTQPYEKTVFSQQVQASSCRFHYLEPHLNESTVALAKNVDAVCVFVNDTLDAPVLEALASQGVRFIALRCAGYNNVDVAKAQALGLTVVRVPAYSPYAVAEHALALLMTLNRKTHKAYQRVRDGNFLLDGLVGFDVHGKTVGIIGTGQIGQVMAGIFKGLGCSVLAYDPYPTTAMEALGATYVPLETLYQHSDIISLHCPLMPNTHHLINATALEQMKLGVVILNTSRGGLVDTQAVIDALKQGRIGGLGLDVYEEESDLFFEDFSASVIQDDVFSRLLTFPNVVITGHQAFLTHEALGNIAQTTLANLEALANGTPCPNVV